MELSRQNKIIIAVLAIIIVLIAFAIILKMRIHHAPTKIESAPSLSSTETTPNALTNLFDNKESRYRIHYPVDWERDEAGPGTMVFSGKKDTPSFYSTVNVQAILSKKAGGDYSNIHDFVADIKQQARRQSNHVKFLEETPITLSDQEGKKIKGISLLFSYDYKNVSFKQWQIVVLRNDQQVFYAWAYTSPLQQYENDYGTAKAMLNSWTIY